ncbi:threonine/serine exporter family protein [Anaerosporobacter faecicola]|uniref:threonine/serine exporter family protein n=1 Tax=Anaerosporobacter faecicola TaxID=2718714 RepID=UPI001A9B1E81|nr:threonine/serine exporter family protein [Anaerosporobacter faecicola]
MKKKDKLETVEADAVVMKESMEKEHLSRQERQAQYKLLMDTALLAGQIMLKSGAETYRVEDTICRILQTSGLETAETFATVTGLFVTLADPSIDAITQIARVSEKQSNLSQVYDVNDISRSLCGGKITVQEAYDRLLVIKKKQEYPLHMVYIGIVMTSSFFTLLLGGGVLASCLSALNGLCIVLCRHITGKVKLNNFITDMLSSFIIAVGTMFYAHMIHNSAIVEITIVGSIMPLVPGVAITNAIRDTLQGDYLSGGSRAIEAFVIAACIAVGIGVGLAFSTVVIGGSML